MIKQRRRIKEELDASDDDKKEMRDERKDVEFQVAYCDALSQLLRI